MKISEFPVDLWSEDDEEVYGATKKKKNNKKTAEYTACVKACDGKRSFIVLSTTFKDTDTIISAKTPDAAAKKAVTGSKGTTRVFLREANAKQYGQGFRLYKYDVKTTSMRVEPTVTNKKKGVNYHNVVDSSGNPTGTKIPAFAVGKKKRGGFLIAETKTAVAVKTGPSHLTVIYPSKGAKITASKTPTRKSKAKSASVKSRKIRSDKGKSRSKHKSASVKSRKIRSDKGKSRSKHKSASVKSRKIRSDKGKSRSKRKSASAIETDDNTYELLIDPSSARSNPKSDRIPKNQRPKKSREATNLESSFNSILPTGAVRNGRATRDVRKR